jgi:hypothetical protein
MLASAKVAGSPAHAVLRTEAVALQSKSLFLPGASAIV